MQRINIVIVFAGNQVMDKNKFFYIGQVSRKVEVPTHILRYWEKEFSYLKPLRDSKGNRVYTLKDINRIEEIKSLVYGKGYRIKGAKKELRDQKGKKEAEANRRFLKIILNELQELKRCLR